MKPFIFIDALSDEGALRVFDPHLPSEMVPSEFNAVCVKLEGTADSRLDWKATRQEAVRYVGQGLRLLWEIDLGLFDRLLNPLSHRPQFLALDLAVQHFCETLWPEFRDHTLGLCLYRGGLDFEKSLPSDPEREALFHEWMKERGNKAAADLPLFRQFCCDAAVQYIDLLASRLPEGLHPVVLLDTSTIEDGLEMAQLLTKERFERLNRAITSGYLPAVTFLRPESSTISFVDRKIDVESDSLPTIGICLPPMAQFHSEQDFQLKNSIEVLSLRKIPFRIISEISLITDWDGLDYLLVASNAVTPQGVRKLLGFCAAGGTVVSLGKPIGVPQEIPFSSWIEKKFPG